MATLQIFEKILKTRIWVFVLELDRKNGRLFLSYENAIEKIHSLEKGKVTYANRCCLLRKD